MAGHIEQGKSASSKKVSARDRTMHADAICADSDTSLKRWHELAAYPCWMVRHSLAGNDCCPVEILTTLQSDGHYAVSGRATEALSGRGLLVDLISSK